MTCGCCHPELFKPESGVAWGYTATANSYATATAIRRLYYQGAHMVVFDKPVGRVLHRPALDRLRRWMAAGDRLILSTTSDLGTRLEVQERVLGVLHGDGVEVFTLSSDAPDRPLQSQKGLNT